MAGEDKTEDPTAKRLSESRKKGQLGVSKELGNAIGLAALMGVFYAGGGWLLQGYADLLRSGLQLTSKPSDEPMLLMSQAWSLAYQATPLLFIPAAAVGLLGIAAGLLQTKFNFATEALKPSFKTLDPVQGIKRLVGYKGFFEVLKELLKLTVVAAAAYLVLWPQREKLAQLVGLAPLEIIGYLGMLVVKLGFAVSIAYLLIAIGDVAFQRFSTKKDQKMTKAEVKQEARQTDLAPEVKSHLRQRQMEASRKRMLSEVPEADVVITNPTHFAVALKYSAEQPAPQVVATGSDLLAKKIRQTAEAAGVEIIENPPLARALYSSCSPGDWVPESLYVAVAEILAFVYRRKERTGISLSL